MRNLLPGSKEQRESRVSPQTLLGPPAPELPSPSLLALIRRIEMEGAPAPVVYGRSGYVATTALAAMPILPAQNVENWHAAKLAAISSIPWVELSGASDTAIRSWMVAARRERSEFLPVFLDENQLDDMVARNLTPEQVAPPRQQEEEEQEHDNWSVGGDEEEEP